jgi:hypothetical protein
MREVVRDQNVKNECGNQPEESKKWRDSGYGYNSRPPASQTNTIPRIEIEAKRRYAGSRHANDSKEQKRHYYCESCHSDDYTAVPSLEIVPGV